MVDGECGTNNSHIDQCSGWSEGCGGLLSENSITSFLLAARVAHAGDVRLRGRSTTIQYG